MSITLARLRTLQRQANVAPKLQPPSPQPSPPQKAVGEKGLEAVLRISASVATVAPTVGPPAAPGPLSPVACDGGEGWGEGGSSAVRDSATSIAALRRLLGVRERKPFVTTVRGPLDRALPGEEIAPGLRLIETRLPYTAPTAALSLAFAKRDGEAVPPRDLLFFDTETTGLAGGTGTRAFMIGAADWLLDPLQGETLRIRQLLITTMAAEAAMLDTFAQWLSPRTVLSSYNGRCYDSPLLKTRYRLARRPCPITPLDHVDLLFPTRRRYRGVWENCRLATIERELLKIVREDDLPGSEAPAAWLNFLRGGSAINLRRVAAHNHQDVVTLARLMERLVDEHAQDTGIALAPPR